MVVWRSGSENWCYFDEHNGIMLFRFPKFNRLQNYSWVIVWFEDLTLRNTYVSFVDQLTLQNMVKYFSIIDNSNDLKCHYRCCYYKNSIWFPIPRFSSKTLLITILTGRHNICVGYLSWKKVRLVTAMAMRTVWLHSAIIKSRANVSDSWN